MADMSTDTLPRTIASTTEPQCRLLRAGEGYIGKQGLQYNVGISAETVGAQSLHMQMVTIPPGGRARAHKHSSHETAIYALKGSSAMWHGPRLEHHSVIHEGDFLYIPADVPHLPYNPSATEEVVAVIARTDPNEQESVVLLPELEGIHPLAGASG
jgi:uncharacterized RmlC-like cupin family protein